MAQQERTRTPDRLQGAEQASRAIANVLNFTLQNQLQQEQQRKALEAVAQEQQFKQQLQQQESQAAMERLQKDLAYRREVEDRLRKQAEDERRAENLKRRSQDMFRTEELTLERRKLDALNKLRAAKALESQKDLKAESLAKSIDERIQQLRALDPYVTAGNPSAMMRSRMIMEELRPLQEQLDIVRSGGAVSPDFGKNLYGAQRKGFQDYIMDYARGQITTPPERLEELRQKEEAKGGNVYQQAPDLDTLNQVAGGKGGTQKPLEEMTIDELIQEFSK